MHFRFNHKICSTDSGFNDTILRKMFIDLKVMVKPKRFDEIEYSLELERAMEYHNYTYEKLMFHLMQPCDQMLLQCVWLKRIRPCNEMFDVSRTTHGFCCSFNTIDNLRYIGSKFLHVFLHLISFCLTKNCWFFFYRWQISESNKTLCFRFVYFRFDFHFNW